jgi:hypothetical protein
MSGLLDQLVGLLVPTACAGCRARGELLCNRCRSGLVTAPLVQTSAGVWAHDDRYGLGRAAVKALKLGDQRALLPLLGGLLADAVAQAVATWQPAPTVPIVLVPVPRRRAARKQGRRDTVHALARCAASNLRAWPAGVHVEAVARFVREPRDQRTLTVAGRRENLVGAMVAGPIRHRGAAVIAVDDVVTTGSTLAELVRALRATGQERIGAAAVTSTALHAANIENSRTNSSPQ